MERFFPISTPWNDSWEEIPVSGLCLNDLSVLSGWSRLKKCQLMVEVELDEVVPSINGHPPDNEPTFAHWFVVPKDANFLPRLKKEWSASFTRLENIEVVAARCIDGNHLYHFRPLICALRCGLGRLHYKYTFTHYESNHF